MASVRKIFPQRKRHQQRYKQKGKGKSDVIKVSRPTQAQKELDILKKFDLSLEFGPCIGITRLERWERAEKYSLNPPAEVKNIINNHKDDKTYTECLWNEYSILK